MNPKILFSLIIPVYKNEDSLSLLLARVTDLHRRLDGALEAIFVVDASPDRCHQILLQSLPACPFPAELIHLSRNFGSAAACRMGLSVAHGQYFAAMAADLQEPAELILSFFEILRQETIDIVLGVRSGRDDPLPSKLSANLFWLIYKKFVQAEMPAGGIDVFGCNRKVRDMLLQLHEANTSLAGQLIWLGFRRQEIPYRRLARSRGKSSWTFCRKVGYMLDSIFSFTDLPITAIMFLGWSGLLTSLVLATSVLVSWYCGKTDVPGYTPLILVMFFSLSLLLISLGIIGNYVWRSFENTKNRPLFLPMGQESFSPPRDSNK